jgi:glucose/mannose transport system substrate-binding protein
MNAFMKPLLGAAAALALSTAPVAAAPLKAEVLHWWTSGGESAAVKQFADAFTKAGGEWIDTAIAVGENARAAGINRIVGGDPPTAMQFNTGKQFDDLIAQGLLRPMDEIAEREGWKDVLPEAFLKSVTRDGHVYAVPVNNHGQNWLWYSTAAFEKAGAKPPETWDEFFAAADKLKAAGFIPLALGGQPWQERITFSAVLLSAGGKDLFLKIYRDKDQAAIKSPEFLKVAETFGKLRGLVDEGAPNRNWNDAANLIITGKAGMQFMGDWEKGEFIAAGWTAGKEYGCILGPGEKNFMMGGDVFVFPKIDDPEQQKAQDTLATLMLSKEVQVAFNNKKGSVPVRTDVDTSGLDACAQVGVGVLADKEKQIPSTDMLITPDLTGQLNDIIAEFFSNPGMGADELVKNIATAFEQAS